VITSNLSRLNYSLHIKNGRNSKYLVEAVHFVSSFNKKNTIKSKAIPVTDRGVP
jgi:hypothetical protein